MTTPTLSLSPMSILRPPVAANALRFNPWAALRFPKPLRQLHLPPSPKAALPETDFQISTERIPASAYGATPSSDERAVRAVIVAMTQAIRARNAGAVLALCAPNVVCYDAAPHATLSGAAAVSARWVPTWNAFEGEVACEATQLRITLGADVAFSHSQLRLSGKAADGRRSTQWVCATLGLRRIEGIWRFVHQHFSEPVERFVPAGLAVV